MDNETREAIRDRLAEICKANGGVLTPEAVVEDAKSKASPLHGQFTWNTKEAAYQHWLDQARSLIRTVRVVVTEEWIRAPAYVRDPNAEHNAQGYVETLSLRSDADAARAVVVAEFARAAAAMRRAREVAKVLDLEREVDELIGLIEVTRTSVSQQAAAN